MKLGALSLQSPVVSHDVKRAEYLSSCFLEDVDVSWENGLL